MGVNSLRVWCREHFNFYLQSICSVCSWRIRTKVVFTEIERNNEWNVLPNSSLGIQWIFCCSMYIWNFSFWCGVKLCNYIYIFFFSVNYLISSLHSSTTLKCLTLTQFVWFRIYWLYPLQRDKTSAYDSKYHHMVRLLFWSSRECGVLFHCHYSQVHSDLEGLLGLHLLVKYIYFKIIYIR